MELSFSFKIGNKKKDKSSPLQNNIVPEKWDNNSWFYPILYNDAASYRALKSMYEELPEVQAQVNYIVDKMSNVHYYLNRIDSNGNNTIINDPNKELLISPNQYQEGDDFIKSYFLNRIVLGAAYCNRIKPVGFGKYKQLYILPTITTEPILRDEGSKDPRLNDIVGYYTDFGNGQIRLSKEEVTTSYETNLDPSLTCIRSRLLSAILTSESLRYNYEARVKIYKDRGALGLVAPANGDIAVTEEQATFLRRQWSEETGITGNKAPIRVSQAPMTYTNIGFNIQELQLNENKLQDFQTICSVLNIDSALFENSRGTYNNKILAKRNFWEDVGMPYFNSYLKFLGKTLDLKENERYIADYSDIPALQEDYEKKVNANSKAWNDGIITEAEYRESIGFDGGEEKKKTELERSRAITQQQAE